MDIQIKYEVRWFKTKSGNQPARDDLFKLTTKQERIEIGKDIFKLQVLGLEVGRPLLAKLNTYVWELRHKIKGNQYRTLFGIYKNNILILTCFFFKKTSKIPNHIINTATDRIKEVLKNEK